MSRSTGDTNQKSGVVAAVVCMIFRTSPASSTSTRTASAPARSGRLTDRCAGCLTTAVRTCSSSVDLQSGLCKEALDQMGLLSEAADSEVELLVEFFQVQAHQVAQLYIFQMMPASFIPRVQVGGVSRQSLQPDLATR